MVMVAGLPGIPIASPLPGPRLCCLQRIQVGSRAFWVRSRGLWSENKKQGRKTAKNQLF